MNDFMKSTPRVPYRSNYPQFAQTNGWGGVKPVIPGSDFMTPQAPQVDVPTPMSGEVASLDTLDVPNTNSFPKSGLPDAKGAWMDKANLGLGVAKVGLGVFNALEQAKVNKFMKSYYGNQLEMTRTDFANSARSANEALASKRERILSARGVAVDSDESKADVSSYMSKWGAKENF